MGELFSTRAIPPSTLETLRPVVRGEHVGLDVSVLLAGLLDPGSYSNQCLTLLADEQVVLSSHVEEMATRVLRANAPYLVGDFGDGLIQLAQHTDLTRVPTVDRSELPDWAAALSGEDQQVLAEVIAGGANVLLTHDSRFFLGTTARLRIESPSSFLWSANDPRNIEADSHEWTYVGLFWPDWGSEIMRRTPHEFYMLDLTGKAECFYDTRKGAFVLKWYERAGLGGTLTLPQVVEPRSTNFVSVAASDSGILLFANGESRRRATRVGPVPQGAMIYPFNNSRGGGQISGGARFRMAKGRMSEKRIRRLWRSRSLRLSDGELRFHELASTIRKKWGGQL